MARKTQKEALSALVQAVEAANAAAVVYERGEEGLGDGIAFAVQDAKKALERIDGEKAAGIRKVALERLLEPVIRAAVMGPARRDAHKAGIPWDAFEAMRDELERLGVGWRGMRHALGLRPVPKKKEPKIANKLDGEEGDLLADPSLGAGASVEAYRG